MVHRHNFCELSHLHSLLLGDLLLWAPLTFTLDFQHRYACIWMVSFSLRYHLGIIPISPIYLPSPVPELDAYPNSPCVIEIVSPKFNSVPQTYAENLLCARHWLKLINYWLHLCEVRYIGKSM